MRQATFAGDDWLCECGNRPHTDGFYPCQAGGELVEPTAEDWTDGSYYRCVRCDAIICHDDAAGAGCIVGKARPEFLGQVEPRPRRRFAPGRIVITTNAAGRLDSREVQEGLRRHLAGDWGELSREDAALNERALAGGGRILSAYGEGEGRFWVITEAGRSLTTVLLPGDY